MKDLRANGGHNPMRRKFNKGSVKGHLAALEQQVSVLQSNQGTNDGVAQNIIPLAPQHAQMPPPTLKAVITIISLPSLTNEPDARLKGTEKLMDHQQEELLSQVKNQPDTPVQPELPELALSHSIMNQTMSWTVMQTMNAGKACTHFHGP